MGKGRVRKEESRVSSRRGREMALRHLLQDVLSAPCLNRSQSLPPGPQLNTSTEREREKVQKSLEDHGGRPCASLRP